MWMWMCVDGQFHARNFHSPVPRWLQMFQLRRLNKLKSHSPKSTSPFRSPCRTLWRQKISCQGSKRRTPKNQHLRIFPRHSSNNRRFERSRAFPQDRQHSRLDQRAQRKSETKRSWNGGFLVSGGFKIFFFAIFCSPFRSRTGGTRNFPSRRTSPQCSSHSSCNRRCTILRCSRLKTCQRHSSSRKAGCSQLDSTFLLRNPRTWPFPQISLRCIQCSLHSTFERRHSRCTHSLFLRSPFRQGS